MTTYNLRGFTSAKTDAVKSLLASVDILGLNKTWIERESLSNSLRPHAFVAGGYRSDNRYRTGGGVVLLCQEPLAFSLKHTIVEKDFQILNGFYKGDLLTLAYAKPQMTKDSRATFLFHLTRVNRSSGVIFGDLNARHPQWDTAGNAQGTTLLRWATQTRYRIPTQPSCYSTRGGNSVVDLFLVRDLPIPTTQVLTTRSPAISDYKPVRASLALSTPAGLKGRIPQSILKNPVVEEQAGRCYDRTLPLQINKLEEASSVMELEEATTAFAQPWYNLSRQMWRLSQVGLEMAGPVTWTASARK